MDPMKLSRRILIDEDPSANSDPSWIDLGSEKGQRSETITSGNLDFQISLKIKFEIRSTKNISSLWVCWKQNFDFKSLIFKLGLRDKYVKSQPQITLVFKSETE